MRARLARWPPRLARSAASSSSFEAVALGRARAQGQESFPDGTNLVYRAIAATVAGCIAVVNLVGLVLEDVTGKKPLR